MFPGILWSSLRDWWHDERWQNKINKLRQCHSNTPQSKTPRFIPIHGDGVGPVVKMSMTFKRPILVFSMVMFVCRSPQLNDCVLGIAVLRECSRMSNFNLSWLVYELARRSVYCRNSQWVQWFEVHSGIRRRRVWIIMPCMSFLNTSNCYFVTK